MKNNNSLIRINNSYSKNSHHPNTIFLYRVFAHWQLLIIHHLTGHKRVMNYLSGQLIVDNNDTTVINFSVKKLWKFHYDHDRSTIITSNVRKEMANYAWRIIKHDARTISLRSYKVKLIHKTCLPPRLLPSLTTSALPISIL